MVGYYMSIGIITIYNNRRGCFDYCPDGEYADDDLRECVYCDISCNNCYGPDSN